LKITGLIWFHEIVDKLYSKHRVEKAEVREALDRKPHFQFVERGHHEGENVYAALGRTEAGRYLTVFFVHKLDGRALIISARDMTKTERKKYERK